jgi:hypothetical protein
MPIYNFDVQSYTAGVTLQNNSFGFIRITPPPDFHGGVHNLTIYFFDPASGAAAFSGEIVGSSPFVYQYYVFMTNQTMFDGLLEILETSGPKHVSLFANGDIPISGSFTIPVTWVGITTDSLAIHLAALQELHLPDHLRQLVPKLTINPGK